MALRKKPEEPEEELEILVQFEGDELTREERQLLEWRTTCLTQAGVDKSYAVAIANIGGLDLHHAIELKAKGCSDALLHELLR